MSGKPISEERFRTAWCEHINQLIALKWLLENQPDEFKRVANAISTLREAVEKCVEHELYK